MNGLALFFTIGCVVAGAFSLALYQARQKMA